MLDVRERVPLRGRLRIKIVQVVVEHELRSRENLDRVGMLAAGEQRRIGNVDRKVEREDFAALDRRFGGDDPLGGLQIDGSNFVVVTEHAPRGALGRARTYREFAIRGYPGSRGGSGYRLGRGGGDLGDF